MVAPLNATIFAYQVGFGDCFLLRFSYPDGARRHILIDFGTTGLPENVASSHMLRVAEDIRDKCGGRNGVLDVLVATHRHRDHISGFATSNGVGSGDIIRKLAPKVIIQPWTEAPEAPVDWLGPEHSDVQTAFASRRASLAAMQQVAQRALTFLDLNGASVPRAIADQLRFVGENNLSNRSAIDNLQAMEGRHEYVFHGCDPGLADVLPGIEVNVLGPPTLRQSESIRKQRSSDPDEFWQLTAQRLVEATTQSDAKPLFPGKKSVRATRLFTEQRWLSHRIDDANAELMLGLVRALDDQMNNTSVILLFRAGKKTLLFPGDAQIENWQYALQSKFAKLLADVDVYKVGHHGSRNATPRSMWNSFSKRGGETREDRLVSVLSTKHGKHGSEDKKTEVPRRTLVNELEAKSNFHSTELLADGVLYEEIPIALG
ncbi:hypothetical protein NKI86_06995 [Mesorhizobium sp. M0320]|uniref:hypothetical protein n=1 Tax=Mesorhizobium sp. M0320 TaxID=2956936 RepID=UPI0033370A19